MASPTKAWVAPELLSLLRCPESGQPLHLAPGEIIARVQAERLPNRAGQPPRDGLEGGLLREDGRLLFPIYTGLPHLLLAEAIAL